jgi:hypothetical protein
MSPNEMSDYEIKQMRLELAKLQEAQGQREAAHILEHTQDTEKPRVRLPGPGGSIDPVEVEREYKKRFKKKYRRKKKGKIDARSHKHAAKDATLSKSGIGGAIAPLAAVYTWLKDKGIIDEDALIHNIVGMVPDWLWVTIALLGTGWWLMVYAATIQRKMNNEY